jgi:NhaA family Na+:H+ antiporter
VVYLLLNSFLGGDAFSRGWGIPTATDIALAWLVARIVFGASHPAIPFLLLLAIADDAIGLVIIALFYPDPALPVLPLWLLLTLLGGAIAYSLGRYKVKSYWPYLILAGLPSWFGLHLAHLHPALALVFVVPFFPHPPREELHLFEENPTDRSTIARFEHEWKVVVDFGLFFFGLANAGVSLSAVGTVTWLVFSALLFGKTVGVFSLAMLADRFGFPLPTGMGWRELLVAGVIAGIGFTVAIFVAGEAFIDPAVQGAAKMGAMLSLGGALVALILARGMRLQRRG